MHLYFLFYPILNMTPFRILSKAHLVGVFFPFPAALLYKLLFLEVQSVISGIDSFLIGPHFLKSELVNPVVLQMKTLLLIMGMMCVSLFSVNFSFNIFHPNKYMSCNKDVCTNIHISCTSPLL